MNTIILLILFGNDVEAKPSFEPISLEDSDSDETDEDSEKKEDEEEKEQQPTQKKSLRVTKGIVKKDIPEPITNTKEESDDGVTGEVDENLWNKLSQTENQFGLIFRPQLGVTALKIGESQSYSGYHAGINLGYKKYHRLKLANVGLYSRHRALFLPTAGEIVGSDMRIGSVIGMKLSAFELETGLDLLRHSMGVRGENIDFGPSVGVAMPLQALVIFDDLKIKAELEPRWYLDDSRAAIVWEDHDQLTKLPIRAVGDEFTWTLGFRMGWFGLSYEQLHMNGGIQRTMSFGLQR